MEAINRVIELEKSINEKLKNNDVIVRITKSENENEAMIVILKNKKISRVYHIKAISQSEINIFDNERMLESGLFTDDLVKWIYNIYNKVEYVYTFYGDKLDKRILNRDEVIKISNGKTKDFSEERIRELLVHRKELDNQPTVTGYLGPMFDGIDFGKVILRYESQEAYDAFSS